MDRRKFINTIGIAGMGGAAFGGVNANADKFDLTTGTYQNGPPLIVAGTTLVAASDAPSSIKNASDYVCTGTADHLVINEAIAELGDIGGQVQLSQGTFYCAGAVRMKRLTSLFGRGRSTVLKAVGTWPSFDGLQTWGGVIEPEAVTTDKTLVAYLTIDGNKYQNSDVHGIYYNITTQAPGWFGPDAGHYFTDLYIFKTRRNAFHLTGGRLRATKASRMRTFDTGTESDAANGSYYAAGFYLDSPDGFFSQCEAGGSTGHGFAVEGSNLHFNGCKAWFSDLNGWNIQTPRGQYSSCEAQDNKQHGFYIKSGPNSFVGCHADSNSWNPQAPVSAYDGFNIPFASRVQLIGCAAYDKGETSHNGHWQRDGFNVGDTSSHIQIIGVAEGNTRSGLFGTGQAGNLLMVQGQ